MEADKTKIDEIVEMRLEGKTYRAISRETGASHEEVRQLCEKDPRIQSTNTQVLRRNVIRNALVKIIQKPELVQHGSGPKGLQINIQMIGDKAIDEATEKADIDSIEPIDIMHALLERLPEPRLDSVLALAIAAAARGTDTWGDAARVLGIPFRRIRYLKEKDSLRSSIEELIDKPCVDPKHSPRRTKLLGTEGELSIKGASRETEAQLIREALDRTGGNRTHASTLLDISHRALLYKMRDYGVDTPAPGYTRKLNSEAVRVIKWFLKNRPDVSREALADAHKISKSSIKHIVANKYWSYVEA